MRRILSLVMFGLAASGMAPLSAQARLAPQAGVAWETSRAIMTRRELVATGAFVLGTLAVMPLDESVARASQRAVLQQSAALRGTAHVFRDLGDPGTVVFGVGTYAAGVLFRNRTVADVGLHTTAAVVVSGAVTAVLKGALGRARPYAVRDSNPWSYAAGRGFRGGGAFQSSPSGHTSAAFAVASVLASEARHRWPRGARYIAPLSYVAAALVGGSRVYDDKHWLSDVVLGAGIGTVSGWSVTRFQHARPENRIDGLLLPTARSVSISPRVSAGTRGPATAGVSVRF